MANELHNLVSDQASPPLVITQSVVTGLVGRGIQLSRTPAMHEAEGTAHGIKYIYQLIDVDTVKVEEIRLPQILEAAEIMGFSGLNITYPFKQQIIPYLDTLSVAAQSIGAVNTVVFKDGKRAGHNTDYWGFSESFRMGLPNAKLDCVLMVGAGGAGSAVANALLDLGVKKLLVMDINDAASEDLSARMNSKKNGSVEVVKNVELGANEANGIVNTSPMGMAKMSGSPISLDLLRPDHWVADVVYFPLETSLLQAAKLKGCRTLAGSGMAICQAHRAFELFTDIKPDFQRMEATFNAFDKLDSLK